MARPLRGRRWEWYGRAMADAVKNDMDVGAFLRRAEGREGRWELRDGQPVLMAPERAAHALTK